MNLLVVYRQGVSSERLIDCYPRSFMEELVLRGHKVTPIGEGHTIEQLEEMDVKKYDYLIELENGRGRDGELVFQQSKAKKKIPSAVWFIDSHGYPSLHKRAAKHYDHVFFAVYFRRDLFRNHRSAHWMPNATDLRWFGHRAFSNSNTDFDFGFFGSKGGLARADALADVCARNGWTCDIRQVGKAHRHKWPRTGEAMAKCRILFNHGQKHDGPNQRVLESMAMRKLLLTDLDPRDGMSKLFVEGYHFIGYESYTYADLEEKARWCMEHGTKAKEIAACGAEEVKMNHTIGNRVDQLLEVIT